MTRSGTGASDRLPRSTYTGAVRSIGLALALALVLVTLVFGPHLGGEFVWDDAFLVRDNAALSRPEGLGAILTQDLWGQARREHTTGQINRVLRAALDHHSPHARKKSKLPKAYYATQIRKQPPTFVIFVNEPSLFADNYMRYL